MAGKVKGDLDICRTLFGRSFGLSRTVTTTSASTLTLNAFSTTYQIFTGSTVGQVLNLGNATTYYKDGHSYFILNDSSEDVIIENSGGTDLFTLQAGFGVLAVLEDGSTANGSWRFFLFVDNTLEFINDFAAPGYPFGKSGTVTSGTWLLRVGGMPTSKTGYNIDVEEPELIKITCASEDLDTYDIEVWQHDGNLTNSTLIDTVSVVASRKETFTVSELLTKDKHIAVKLSSGTAKNVGVDLSITGKNS